MLTEREVLSVVQTKPQRQEGHHLHQEQRDACHKQYNRMCPGRVLWHFWGPEVHGNLPKCCEHHCCVHTLFDRDRWGVLILILLLLLLLRGHCVW